MINVYLFVKILASSPKQLFQFCNFKLKGSFLSKIVYPVRPPEKPKPDTIPM